MNSTIVLVDMKHRDIVSYASYQQRLYNEDNSQVCKRKDHHDMIKIAVNQSGSISMVPLNGAQVRTKTGWASIKSTDKIYLNGHWWEVGEESSSNGNQLRLVDSNAGVDMLFTPIKAGTLDLSGFGLNTLTVEDSGISRAWYGVSNVSSYPMILGSTRLMRTDTRAVAIDWMIAGLTPDTLGGSTGTYDLAYDSQYTGSDPWSSDFVNNDTGVSVSLSQVDSYMEPIDPSTLFPN